ncbi:MAG TPA: CHASE sensor domain-containing protein [Candidatus Methylacidiphilales bacterium]
MAESTPDIASLLSRKQIGFAILLVVATALLLGGALLHRFVSGGTEAASFVARAEAAALAPGAAAGNADQTRTDLLALRADPLVSAAAVYDAQGTLLADYRRDGAAAPVPEKALPEGQTRNAQGTETSVGIWVGGQPVGAFYLRRAFDWAEFLFPLLVGLAAALLLGLILAAAFASRLGPLLAKPLSAVADKTLDHLRHELENASQGRIEEKAELAQLKASLKQAQDRAAAAERALAEREGEAKTLREQAATASASASAASGGSQGLIGLAEELSLLPAGPTREGAMALAETAAVLAAVPAPSKGAFDAAALAAEAALAARLRAHPAKTAVGFEAFPGIPAAVPGDAPPLLRALTLLLNDAAARTPGGEVTLITGLVKERLRFEIRDNGAAATGFPEGSEEAVTKLGGTLKGKALPEGGTARWFDLAAK